jgi:hypothetical protein
VGADVEANTFAMLGLSAPLLNSSSGPLVQLRSFLLVVNSSSSIKLCIVSAQSGHESWYGAIVRDFSEAALDFEYANSTPTKYYSSALPMSHPTPNLADSAEQILNQISRRQHAPHNRLRSASSTSSTQAGPHRFPQRPALAILSHGSGHNAQSWANLTVIQRPAHQGQHVSLCDEPARRGMTILNLRIRYAGPFTNALLGPQLCNVDDRIAVWRGCRVWPSLTDVEERMRGIGISPNALEVHALIMLRPKILSNQVRQPIRAGVKQTSRPSFV